MKLATTLPALCLTATLLASGLAQTPQFTDPANLRGERVKPRDGRELPIDGGQGNAALGLQQLLRRLNTCASILNIVAHPDDEDGGMLTLYSRGLGARVADLALTRGEGGQNAMTGDFEDALGLLRTQELLANDRYTGVDQMFGTEVDFGFSKTKSEAFAKWTHDRVLYDAVRAIRLYRPMVITATFIGGVTDGHGQHQVSGQIAQEAFVAAADPKVFPDMIAEGILPWQALRVYARVPQGAITDKGLYDYATNQYVPATFTNYVTGEVTTTVPSADVIVHEGTPDPLLTPASANRSDLSPTTYNLQPATPLSYVQFARIGLGLQKSQIGPGVRNAPTGAFDVPYHLYGSIPISANGAPHTSLGRSPRSTDEEDNGGLKARLIPTTLTTNPSANGATYTSLGRSPRLQAPQDSAGLNARYIPAGGIASRTPVQPTTDPNFFTGIDTSILGIQALAPDAFPTDMLSDIARGITVATEQFDPVHPDKIAPALAASLKVMDELIPEVEKGRGDPIAKANALHELRIKRVQLNDALALALGVTFDAATPTDHFSAGIAPEVVMTVLKTSSIPVSMDQTQIRSGNSHSGGPWAEGQSNRLIQAGAISTRTLQVATLTNAVASRPYFQRDNIEQPFYDLLDPDLRNAPATPYPLEASASVLYNETSTWLGRIVHDAAQPVSIVPPISLSFSSHAQALPSASSSLILTTIYTPPDPTPISAQIDAPLSWKLPTLSSSENLAGHQTFDFQVPPGHRESTTLHYSVKMSPGQTYTEGYRPIGYGDLPRTNYYTPAITRIVPVDLTLPTHHNIAYLPGTGDAVPEALASIGLTPTILTVADLTPTNLAKFDTVILGVRTYNAHPDLHGAPTQALLDYARNGGNVVVQYQTPEFTAADAPYPLSLGSNEKVVDETAPVALLTTQNSKLKTDSRPSDLNPATAPAAAGTISYPDSTSPGKDSYPDPSGSGLIAAKKEGVLTPAYALLTTPNRITPADFNNWIEERGHGFLATWDPHYTALTETHDPGAPSEHVAPQLPQRGGLITTPLGRGRWTYVAFALYRQLPEAVPGAYRLFLNLLNP
jgi:LmbE family N-acetylglucosaminyl deacetylase